jgi:hypothetical protein
VAPARRDLIIGVEELYEPPVEALPFFLVGYDAAGREVFRRKLEAVRID